MNLKFWTVFWVFVWCLFMGVTAISIGFGALFPSMNRIAKPFVCPAGEMTVDEQTYNPYPGNTITTLTWYCVDSLSGEKVELGIFPMSLYAGLIYGFLLFIVVFLGMFILSNRSASSSPAAGFGAWNYGSDQSESLRRETEKLRAAPQSDSKNLDHLRGKTKSATDALARMKELKELRAANLISESEYESKRAEILKNL